MAKLFKARLFILVLALSLPPACGGTLDEMGTLTPARSTGGTTTTPLGQAWTLQTSPTTVDLIAVADSGSVFVACGNGTFIKSADGITWTAATTTPVGAGCTDVTWTGTQFVAVTGTNSIYLSTDGDIWTTPTTVTAVTTSLNGVGSNGASTVVAVAGAGEIIISTDDGDNWAAAASVPAGADVLFSVIWSSSPARFIAAGANGCILTSPDGSTWTISRASAAGESWLTGVAYDGTTYVAIGGTSGAVTYSTDTTTWTTSATAITATTAEAIDWSNSQFLVVGYTSLGGTSYDSRVSISADGQTWSTGTINALGVQLFDVVGFSGGYVAVGGSGTIVTAP